MVKHLEDTSYKLEKNLQEIRENIKHKIDKKSKSENKNLQKEIVKLRNEAEMQRSLFEKVIGESRIDDFKKDVDVVYTDLDNYGLDFFIQTCQKCDHKTHSEGYLRKHKVTNHNSKETK